METRNLKMSKAANIASSTPVMKDRPQSELTPA